VKEERFVDVLERVKSTSNKNRFGIAGFSFTEERKGFMKFSPSYMADIAVLVSTPDIPIVRSKDDLKKNLKGATALTAQGTVLEKELTQLRDENNMQFKIEYTGGSVELIKLLSQRTNSFGYLNLPVYLLNLDKGLTKLNRQNYLTKRYEGRGIGLPLNSDWDVPLNEYFTSGEFKQQIEFIIANYINIDLYHFMETFTPENEVSLLNKEKDIQQMEIRVQQMEIDEKNQKQKFFMIIVATGSALLLVIGLLYRKQLKDHRQLKEQKAEIEAQSDEILSINNNLENIVKDRTKELENKNKALADYAFITAHKLRSPLSTILGLVDLMHKMNVPEEDKILIKHLDQSAKNLDVIIHDVMAAIDKTEPPKSN
ncbi:MAG: hypothetical protein HOP37_14275, partial [Cyclobacteriaceae bacterium]|nr:hypothetical protein [Cyclobacteriaceae bacterium]